MKTSIVKLDGKTYVELTPRPNAHVKHGLKIRHHSYDYWTHIEPGKKYYRLNNPQSVDKVRIVNDVSHAKDGPIYSQELIQAVLLVTEHGVPKYKLAEKLNIKWPTIRDNLI